MHTLSEVKEFQSPREARVKRVFVCKTSVNTSQRIMPLDVNLLHSLEGVDTTLVTNSH